MITLHARNTSVSSHTKPRAALARSDRLTPDDFGLSVEARLFWRELTADRGLMKQIAASPIRWIIYRLRRNDDRSDPLEVLARVVVWLANAHVPESVVRRIPLFINRLIDDCYAGNARRSIDDLDRAEQALEQHQNVLQLERRIDGHATAEELDQEASAIEAEAALEIERARELRRQARITRADLAAGGAR